MTLAFEDRIRAARTPDLFRRYFREASDAMPPERLAAYQTEALKEIVAIAHAKSPFYQEQFRQAGVRPDDIQERADLAKLPFTTKDDLRQDPWRFLACDKADVSIIHVSTGTTGGKPIYVLHTWADYYMHDLAPGFPVLVPVGRGDMVLNALPYEMSSAGLAFHKSFINSCGATVLTAGKGGAYSTPEKTVQMIRDLQPNCAITTPSYAVTLHETALKEGFDLKDLPWKKMWLTGEGSSPAFRERVEKLWGTRANMYYGTLEGGVVGIECDEHRGYHVTESHVILEVVDPKTGTPLEPLEVGEIVVTCLTRRDAPLIRYRTQDLGYFDPDPCPCGVPLPLLHLRGRQGDQIRINGVDFSPFYLEEFLMRQPEVGNWYQFIVKKGDNDRLKIRTELAPKVTATAELADKLSSKMEYAVGVPCAVEIVDAIPRPRGKTVRVVREEAAP
ncbi:coenzyme f390 synthetase, putative [Heliomicrobium modesticaldum Ice1]|uniref:Coenzyme f390 synthetase, putative n=1 Tax=Heliobacterium modesticaldum (strain ATCC 51547 / Ice1) TaxID=498761 RepID=B0TEU7_HELMI|nr:AMP-binding protein [Heliomicrobium modesticaldum]ABZ84349.1 coenzyme f390 synthetase, putative [Heliomicrobium modesticaldum Ice1]